MFDMRAPLGNPKSERGWRLHRQSLVNALTRQQKDWGLVKRERWTEADIYALPNGEHDYFDRKSGKLLSDRDHFLGTLAKAASAFANSGGGHLLLGVGDSGIPDGVPPFQGKTPTREWIEQVLPNLVSYPLSDFRVHRAEPAAPSKIPPDTVVVVIDFGDSALAPHQCVYAGGGESSKYTYYYRQAGHSVPAPHFYLELLRQRLVNPALEVTKVTPRLESISGSLRAMTLEFTLDFLIENVGRIAAYRWQLVPVEVTGVEGPQGGSWDLNRRKPGPRAVRIGDRTILPGCTDNEQLPFSTVVELPWEAVGAPSIPSLPAIRMEAERALRPISLEYRIATEFAPGDVRRVDFGQAIDLDELAAAAVAQFQRSDTDP